jgi:uncharacterized membrane protein
VSEPGHQNTGPSKSDDDVSEASAWVLRIGVVVSTIVMLTGIAITFIHNRISVERMKTDGFDYRPSVICEGIARGEGKRVIEAGIYLLVFTPIMRVFASFLIFAFHDRDRTYALITIVVLLLTLAGLLWIG